MKDRIVKFLIFEKISPSEFADKIGVQRSSMSHILNGRNFPSASFLQKMLQAFPQLNPRWLMIGDGEMNAGTKELENVVAKTPIISSENEPQSIENDRKTGVDPTESRGIFSASTDSSIVVDNAYLQQNRDKIKIENLDEPKVVVPNLAEDEISGNSLSNPITSLPAVLDDLREVEQILFFYKDKTFTVYKPS
jgi:transcriptional regulator with XRE-family HTH domain